MISVLFFYGGFAVLALRLALGAIFVAHGWPKVLNLKRTAISFEGMGFRPGRFWGSLVGFLEFFASIAFVFGILLQPIAALVAVEFIVIIVWKLMKRMPFVGGWEMDLLILAAAVALVLLGAGAYSLDRMVLI